MWTNLSDMPNFIICSSLPLLPKARTVDVELNMDNIKDMVSIIHKLTEPTIFVLQGSLSTNVQNALLKCTEEQSDYAYFVLITDAIVLDTLKSRGFVYDNTTNNISDYSDISKFVDECIRSILNKSGVSLLKNIATLFDNDKDISKFMNRFSIKFMEVFTCRLSTNQLTDCANLIIGCRQELRIKGINARMTVETYLLRILNIVR